MTTERWKSLMSGESGLTRDEVELGWHWCWEMDGLLVGPECYDLHGCHCLPSDHPVYLTTPQIETVAPMDGF